MKRRYHRNESSKRTAISTPETETADKLLAWAKGYFGRCIRDVFAWRVGDEMRYAFNGPAEAMIVRMGFDIDHPLNNNHGYFDYHLAHAFGVHTKWMGNYSEPSITHLSDTFQVGQMLEGIAEFLKSQGGDYDVELDVTIIPEPGYPWAGPGTRYYSAREKKIIVAKKPAWTVPVVVRDPGSGEDIARLGANWCMLAPRSEPAIKNTFGYVTLSDRGGETESVFFTHTLDLKPTFEHEKAAKEILRCKGLLFPSLAVAPIPGSNYGPCTLVADPMLVLREIKPYKMPRSGLPKAFVYNTDAWTDTTRVFVSTLSAKLYDQLTGNAGADGYIYGEVHLYILGPKAEEEDMGGMKPDDLKPLTNTTQIARELKRRFKLWHGPMNERQFTAAIAKVHAQRGQLFTGNSANYAYLEAKAHTIVQMSSFVGAWVPDYAREKYTSFLRAAGYKGKVYIMPTTEIERAVFTRSYSGDERADAVRYNYAWKLAAEMRKKLTSRELMF